MASAASSSKDLAVTLRNISSFCDWETLWQRLHNATLEENCLKDGQWCLVCGAVLATDRCTYCGPGQFFCLKCANELYENRNQFHVMEKWAVG